MREKTKSMSAASSMELSDVGSKGGTETNSPCYDDVTVLGLRLHHCAGQFHVGRIVSDQKRHLLRTDCINHPAGVLCMHPSQPITAVVLLATELDRKVHST